MLAQLTRWMDRQLLASKYRMNKTWVGFVCSLPMLAAFIVSGALPAALQMPMFFAGLSGSIVLSLWAFWRWFKGYGSSRNSTRMVEQHRKMMAARRHG